MTTAEHGPGQASATVVLEVGGLGWATQGSRVEAVLGRRPGVRAVVANGRADRDRDLRPAPDLRCRAGGLGAGLAGVLAIADAARPTATATVDALHELDVEVVVLTGDNRATAERIAAQLGIDTVIAGVLPQDKAAKVAELQRAGRRWRWSATGSTTPRRWRGPTLASRSAPAPTWRSRPPTSS